MKYRPDIDGLRGIAVLLVVIFHSGLPYISGGFIGVDIFFVISGYLITSIIIKDIRQQSFSYINFYERRARRILPALYVVLVLTLIVAAFIQLPNDLSKSAKSVIFAILFSANIFFWRTTDYFSDSTDYEFFLHTWSLGVEEQFYFLFPVVILLFAKRPRWLVAMAVLAFFVSFILSVYTSYYHEWASYYLLPSRAWQMMAGALLAIYPIVRKPGNMEANILSTLALCMMIVPAFIYSKETRFPGVAALLPTLGATLLIWIGVLSERTWVYRLLTLRFLTGIGLISYSLYLWHWPVFAFLKNYQAQVHLPLGLSIFGVVLSFILAYLSWRYIERPFRNRELISRKAIFSLAFIVSIIIIAICSSIIYFNGLPKRLDPTIVRLGGYNANNIIGSGCMAKTDKEVLAGKLCRIGDLEKKNASIVLWGDSHAGSLKQAFDVMLSDISRTGLFAGKTACPPLLGVLNTNFSKSAACLDYNNAVINYLTQQDSIKTVVLHARWALSIEGTRYGMEQGPRYVLKDTLGDLPDSSLNAAVVEKGLGRVIDTLSSAGKQIIVIEGVPEIGVSVPRILANNLLWGKDRDISQPLTAFKERQANTQKIFLKLSRLYPSVQFIRPADEFCQERCKVQRSGEPLYFDDDHVSDVGAELILQPLKPLLLQTGTERRFD